MNKILIFAGAKESVLLIEKLINNYSNLNEFHIIYEKDAIKPKIEEKENIYFYKINFFAFEYYKNIIYKDYNKIILFIKNKTEAKFVLNKVKFTKTPILFIKFWLEFEKFPQINNLEILDLPEILTNKIIDFLPGIPLYARNIGQGKGEILEVEIPIFSPFAYKSYSYFEERYSIRVAAIYRNNELKKIDKNTIILPNDKIILIGKPSVLKELYNQIRKNIGSFPQPYGSNIYLLLDMKNMDKKEISALLKSALFLHRKLKNQKFVIRIINPTINIKIYKLYKFSDIDIYTDYFETSYIKTLKKDTQNLNVGLIVTNNKFFYKYSKEFFNLKKPVFKKGEEFIKKCKALTLILHEKNIKKIASSVFDLSYQLGITLKFFNADPENPHTDIVEYLKHLAKLFNFSNVQFSATKDNPIKKLKNEKDICLIEAIEKSPVSKIREIIMPKIEYSYVLLDKHNQFLIPVIKENYES